MSFIAKNPLSLPEIDYTPSTPSGTRGLYPKEDGWYSIDKDGVEKKLLDLDDMKGLERLQYYGDSDILITPEDYYFCDITEDGAVSIYEGIHGTSEYPNMDLTQLVVPYKIGSTYVSSIDDNAFSYCGALTTITLPNSIIHIGNKAFFNCSKLTSIDIPNTTSIGTLAFAHCVNLTSVTIPDSVTSIGARAFMNCPNLTIICSQGSVADTYAKENRIKVKYDVIDADSLNNSSGGTGAVSSVNGQVGEVVLSAEDVGAYTKDGVDNITTTLTENIYGNIEGNYYNKNTVDNKLASKPNKATTLAGYGIKDAYTKTEVNSKLSSVYTYKGTVDYYHQLPTKKEVGDVYNVRYASGENYEEKPVLYSNYYIEEATYIPPFSDNGLNGFYMGVPFDSKPDFMNGEKLKVGVYAPSYYSTMTGFEVPILDSCPYPATSCAYWANNQIEIFVVYSEAPFNGASQDGYANKGEEIYNYITNHPWNTDEKPLLQFNDEMTYIFEEPYLVNAGDNVAWTGTEWDALGGTEDMSLYAQHDLSNVDNETFKAKAESAGVGGSGGENKDFIVNFTIVDEDMNCAADKTFEEVQAAIQAGYNVYGTIGITVDDVYADVKIPLTISNEDGCWFTGIHLDRSLSICLTQNGECGADLIYVAENSIYDDLERKADKAEEIYEEDVDSQILGENQPKLFKVSRSRMGLMTGFNPYYVYSGEISPLVDGQTTKLYQYKITYDGIYFRTGTREPFVAQNNWLEWAAIGSGSIDLSDYEQTSNKVTEINEDSTDDQYPSAKAVWDVAKNAGGATTSFSSIILDSSTEGSTKQFKITIDDNGTLTATELEGNE